MEHDSDLFAQFLESDDQVLRDLWSDITRQITAIQDEERDLASRRERLEARKAVLDAIAKLRRAEMPPEAPDADPDRRATRSGPREVAFEILNADPQRSWDGETMQRALAEHGIKSTLSNARVLLQRLVQDGRAQRVGRGQYQSANGSSATLLSPVGGD
jgi:hypothetical protein